MAKVYKVVHKEAGRLYSAYALTELRCEYAKGIWTWPKITPVLYAFYTMAWASSFAHPGAGLQVWEAEADVENAVPRILAGLASRHRYGPDPNELIKHLRELWNYPEDYLPETVMASRAEPYDLIAVPPGTVCCSRIKLTKFLFRT